MHLILSLFSILYNSTRRMCISGQDNNYLRATTNTCQLLWWTNLSNLVQSNTLNRCYPTGEIAECKANKSQNLIFFILVLTVIFRQKRTICFMNYPKFEFQNVNKAIV